jgi:hypothetical protein
MSYKTETKLFLSQTLTVEQCMSSYYIKLCVLPFVYYYFFFFW